MWKLNRIGSLDISTLFSCIYFLLGKLYLNIASIRSVANFLTFSGNSSCDSCSSSLGSFEAITVVIIFSEFLVFTKFSLHHKGGKARLLVINWYILVVSRVAKRLKTSDLRKLGKFRIMSKLHGNITYCPVFLHPQKKLSKSAKDFLKTETELFP